MEKKMISLPMASSRTPPPIPNDVIVEILSWVSVSSLMRLRWACKYWFDLITRDHVFSKLHLLHHHYDDDDEDINDDHSLLIFASQYLTYNMKCRDVLHQSSSPETLLKLDLYNLLSPTDGVKTKFLGSCNGLICFLRFSSRIDSYFLWNPSTRELKELPQPPNIYTTSLCPPPRNPKLETCPRNPKLEVHGFGYDHTIDEYKVTRIVHSHIHHALDHVQINSEVANNVYTLGSNSWHTKNETVSLFKRHCILSRSAGLLDKSAGLLANGALHWMTFPQRDLTTIITFDIKKEEHGEIQCPKDFYFLCSELRVLNGYLWVFHEHLRGDTVDVWIMKDYGVKESWTKIFTINLATLTEVSSRFHPVKYLKDSEILMVYNRKYLAAYDTKNYKVKYVQKIEEAYLEKYTYVVVTYVETLISLNSGVFLTPDRSRTTTLVQIQEGKQEETKTTKKRPRTEEEAKMGLMAH